LVRRGAAAKSKRRIFCAYRDAGGNFVDTANYYGRGRSEEMLGTFLKASRHSMVVSTKYSATTYAGNPNGCGNHRLSMVRAVEDSLRRLGTDFIDSRMQMLADLRGWASFVALQIEYSLVQRTVERDLIPMAAELDLGVLPWSPLGGGLLSGRYEETSAAAAIGRAATLASSGKVTERVTSIAGCVAEVARRNGRSSPEVALAWTLANPAVAAPVVGAQTTAQLSQNLAAIDLVLSPEDIATLDSASAIELGFPHDFLQQHYVVEAVRGGMSIPLRR
jgi:aryl-alcohol dehydrogenase-like predicted oxidoreductase